MVSPSPRPPGPLEEPRPSPRETDPANGQAPAGQGVPQEGLREAFDRLRPLYTLVTATLQAAGDGCSCAACQLLLDHASELVPILLPVLKQRGGGV